MKADIHPEYTRAKLKCVCGAEIELGTTSPNIKIEICSQCHPFYTGNQKIIDSEGRVDRFNKRYAKKN